MGTEGFILYTDVSDRLVTHMHRQPIPRAKEVPYNLRSGYELDILGPSVSSLIVVKDVLTQLLPGFDKYSKTHNHIYQVADFTDEDIDSADRYTFAHGLDDRKFPWHFSAGLAAAAIQAFVDEEKISSESRDNLTLGDWADVIGSGWFSRLSHSLAMTGNGLEQNFGADSSEYKRGSLKKLLDRGASVSGINIGMGEPLKVAEELEPDENRLYLTASLSEPYRGLLRAYRMAYRQDGTNGGSSGCPVARRSARVPAEMIDTNHHGARLAELGLLAIHRSSETDEKITVKQEWTAIDRTLAFIAFQLDTYDKLYGTPIVRQYKNKFYLTHKRLPATGALTSPVTE